MEQYTDLKWGIVTDSPQVNCLSDKPSTFHALQSSVLQFALQEDTAPELQNSDIGDQVHDRFTALNDYTRGENVFLPWQSN